jgi:23S rRNA (adenine2030-N6)-methyltransferase
MNYRHAFHAGNFADVFKHAILARIIDYLKRKEGAFRVIDTHAGRGEYELSSQESARTGEWISGIGRLLEADLPPAVSDLLAPYLSTIERINGRLELYPGSPLVARRLLRKQDRLSAWELHEEDEKALAGLFEGDYQVRVSRLDGWLVPGAHLPPKEKRGVVLIDPPFEVPGEFDRIAEALVKAHRRWPGGTVMAWYPLKHETAVSDFIATLAEIDLPKLMRCELWLRPPAGGPAFRGCGAIIKNPPFVLYEELETLLPALAKILGGSHEPGCRVDRISGESPHS